MEESHAYQSIQLIFSDLVRQRLEERLILVEDLQQVIEYAERNGHKLLNKNTGHFLTYHQPANVTYWVEYTPVEEAESEKRTFMIHNAYSHRMVIKGGSQR